MFTDEPPAFGELLRRYRVAAGLTQEALADQAGLSARGVSDLERGARSAPYPDTVRRLAESLQLAPLERAALLAASRRGSAPVAGEPAPERRRSTLPVQLTSFVGREREMAELRRSLGTTRLLTLTGAGGIGKTRLALQVAAEVLPDYSDGVWLVELAPLADSALVPHAVASGLGIREQPSRLLVETLVDALRSKRLLLVLDNCEHVVDGCAELAETLLRTCPHLVLLATSREPLRVAGEASWPVPSLSLPGPASMSTLEGLRASEAVWLFIERAHAVRPDFALTAENAPVVAEVCSRLDGLPLAIELAAAHIRALPMRALLQRLQSASGGLPLLTGGPRGVPERQQTLRATIQWSYALLDLEEQSLFRRLGVFRGCTLEAVEAVCIGPSLGPGSTSVALPPLHMDALAGVTSLVDKSLLRLEEDGEGQPWYVMLETVREFALEHLEATGEAPAVRRRHALSCLRLVEETYTRSSIWSGFRSAEEVVLFNRLEREHANCRAALEWCQAQGYAEPSLRLAVGLWWFWFVRGHAAEGRGRLAALLTRFPPRGADSPRARLQARALHAAGQLAALQGDLATGRPLQEQALGIMEALEDADGIFAVLEGLAFVAYQLGDYEAARAYLDRSLAVARAFGGPWQIAEALANLSTLAHARGDAARARTLLEEGAALFQQIGDVRALGIAHIRLGLLDQDLGELDRARSGTEQALVLLEACGDRRGVAVALATLGSVATARRDFAAAYRHLSLSLRTSQESGEPADIAFVLDRFAVLAAVQGQAMRALRLAGAAAAVREQAQTPLLPAVQRTLDDKLEPARRALGPTADAAGAAGRALPLHAAIAEALGPSAPAPAKAVGGALDVLSRREVEVATLIARGYTNRRIAAELVITEGTAANHVVHILAKLGLATRAQVAVWAAAHRLLDGAGGPAASPGASLSRGA